MEGICLNFGIRASSIVLHDDREDLLVRVTSYGLSPEYLEKGILVEAERTRHVLSGDVGYYADFPNDPRVLDSGAISKEKLASMLSIPVMHAGKVLGLIKMYHSETWELHEDDLDALLILGRQLGLRIEYTGLRNFFETVKHAAGSLPMRMLEGLGA